MRVRKLLLRCPDGFTKNPTVLQMYTWRYIIVLALQDHTTYFASHEVLLRSQSPSTNHVIRQTRQQPTSLPPYTSTGSNLHPHKDNIAHQRQKSSSTSRSGRRSARLPRPLVRVAVPPSYIIVAGPLRLGKPT